MRIGLLSIPALALLAACSTANGQPTPQPVGSPLPLSVQRSQAQAGIIAGKGIEAASLLVAALNTLRASGGNGYAKPTCKNGVERSVKITPDGAIVTIDVFYEPNCTHRFIHGVVTVVVVGSTRRITGTVVTYTRQGRPLDYRTIAATTTSSATSTHVVVRGTVSTSPGGSPILDFGLTCTFSKANTCGFGGVAPAQTGSSFGISALLDGFVASGTGNGQMNLDAYAGRKLSIAPGSGNSWVVKGGSVVVRQAGAFAQTVHAASLNVSGALGLTDVRAGATAGEQFSTRKGITTGGVYRKSGIQDASYSTDAAGNGSIRYSNGSTGTIAFFLIQ